MRSNQTIRDAIARQAQARAQDKSQGKCLSYVGNAFRRAIGEPEGPIGIQSPKNCDQFFKLRGCKQIPIPKQYQNGDIVIFSDFTDSNGVYHQHGHIQVYYNGKWISDFKQKNFSPYRQTPNYRVLRYHQPQTFINMGKPLALLQPIPTNSSPKIVYDLNGERLDRGPSFNFSQKEPSFLDRVDTRLQNDGGGPSFSASVSIPIPCSIM